MFFLSHKVTVLVTSCVCDAHICRCGFICLEPDLLLESQMCAMRVVNNLFSPHSAADHLSQFESTRGSGRIGQFPTKTAIIFACD